MRAQPYRIGYDGDNDPWDWNVGTIPNGTSTAEFAFGTDRLHICAYASKHNTTSPSPAMTIGGVSPSYSYTDTLDLGTDMHLYVFIWDEADIGSMTGQAISTSGTWPSTTSEVWMESTFGGIDQTDPFETGYQTDTVGGPSIDVATPSTPQDLVIMVANVNTAGPDMADCDNITTHVAEQDSGGTMKMSVGEAMGGFQNEIVNFDASFTDLQLRKFILHGTGKRMHVRYAGEQNNRTSTSGSFTDINVASRVHLDEVDSGSKYLLIANMLVGGSNTAVNQFQYRIERGGIGELNPHDARYEPRNSGVNVGNQYFVAKRIFATQFDELGNRNQFDLQYDSNGTDTVSCAGHFMGFIKLDDLDDRYVYNESVSTTGLDNTGWTDLAEITLPEGGTPYVIFWHNMAISNTSSADCLQRIVKDGAVWHGPMRREAEDTVERYALGGVLYLPTEQAGVVLTLQMQTDSATADLWESDNGVLCAIPLRVFEDYFGNRDLTDTNITVTDTMVEHSAVTHTTDTAETEDWIVAGHLQVDVNGENNKAIESQIDDATQGDGNSIESGNYRHNGIDDVIGVPQFSVVNIADATSLDYALEGAEEGDTAPNPIMTEGHIVGFTTKLSNHIWDRHKHAEDDFERTELHTDQYGHGDWYNGPGAYFRMQIGTSGNAGNLHQYIGDNAANAIRYIGQNFHQNQYSEGTLASMTVADNRFAQVHVRMQRRTSACYVAVMETQADTTTDFWIEHNDGAGTFTNMTGTVSESGDPGVGDTLRLEAESNDAGDAVHLRLYYNDVLTVEHIDTTYKLTGGQPAIGSSRSGGQNEDTQWESWKGGELTRIIHETEHAFIARQNTLLRM